jgi:hypothetical protein
VEGLNRRGSIYGKYEPVVELDIGVGNWRNLRRCLTLDHSD